ncbi:MAG: alpha-amylase family glycosyl hydrolase, partial [Spirochaetota bacterium]|nr:alpha-amylase family glycosyl hydrolase [Spirochaetota bacterium]
MIKSNKFYSIRMFVLLCVALVFSCNNITTLEVIKHSKQKLAVPTPSVDGIEVDYGTELKFSYKVSDALLFYTTDGSVPEIDDTDSISYNPNNGIKLTESCEITVRLFHSNYEPSDSQTYRFRVRYPLPEFTPEDSVIDSTTPISIKTPVKGGKIYYSIDSTVELNENNGIEYDSDDDPIMLPAGQHLLKAIVINGKTKSEIAQKIYTVTDKDGVYLDSLTLSKGSIGFKKTTKEYSVNLGYTDESVTITAESSNANVKIGSSNSSPATVSLNVGVNTFVIVVESVTDPSKTNTYTLKIQRAGPDASKDATLANINITSESGSHVSLDKMFDKDTKEYKAEVDNFVTMVKISAGTSDTKAIASYDKEVLLNVGENIVKIVVTAEDTSVTKTYTVVITRKGEIDNNANLKSLLVDSVPVNVSDVMTYPTKASSVKVVATAQSEKITSMKINNVECTGTTVNVPSEVVISIVAADGLTTKNYTLKLVKDSDVELSGLKVDGEDVGVSKNMNVDVKDITAQLTFEVSGDVTKILVNKEDMTATKATSVQVSSSKEISNDKNVKIEVFAADGTSKTYSLDLHYKAPITDKIILHADGYVNAYVWNTGDSSLEKVHKPMTQEGSSSWYTITFNVTKMKVIFTKKAGGWDGQTDDLEQTAGEWWFKDGKWTEYNPEDSTPPQLLTFESDKTGTVSGNVILTVSATDNIGLSKAEFKKADGEVVGSATMKGTSSTVDFVLDTENLKNEAHKITATVYDTAGLASNSEELQFTVFNENPAPIASISGSISISFGAVKTYSASNSKDKNGTVEKYKWSVSGLSYSGSTTGEEITITAPNSPTSFTITLVVTDNEGKDSEPVTITVNVTEPKKSNDFREESIYFLMTARFYDGDSNNNRWCRPDDSGTTGNKASGDYPWRGDFKGLIEKLDYIKAMGFSAIWITPPVLNRSDYDFHGYHAWNMNKIDPRLESAGATYQDLIDKAHEKGIKIIQDIVLNHSCRYGLEDLFSVKYYGSKSITWERGKGIGAEYYDDYNPNFVYDGLNPEPNSGRTYYNGDLWQENAPTITWDTADDPISLWGTKNNQYDFYYFQWPKLTLFNPKYFHTGWLKNWEDETCQTGTIHEDCIDLNTENAEVQKYLIDAYTRYIEMGVDGFRIDTVKHISRNTFNRRFIPAFKEAGGENFYMFGEVCTRVNEVWNHGVAPLSTPFYT